MIKVKLFESNGLYVVRSMSSANSMFFSNKKQKKIAFQLMNRFLTPMMEIIAYSFTERGWALVFRSKSETSIIEAYEDQYSRSKKTKLGSKLEDVRYMISAHFRYFNSGLVRSINQDEERTGSMVKKRIEKFVFRNEAEFRVGVKKVESGEIMETQKLKRFDVDSRMYDDEGMKSPDSEYKNSRRCNSKSYAVRKMARRFVNSFIFVFDKLVVVRQWIELTFSKHFPQNPPNISPKLE